METAVSHSVEAKQRKQHLRPQFPPLELVTTPTVNTAAAAFYLNRQPQTLRGWACREDGALRPLRINGRLAWRTGDLRRVLEVQSGGAQ